MQTSKLGKLKSNPAYQKTRAERQVRRKTKIAKTRRERKSLCSVSLARLSGAKKNVFFRAAMPGLQLETFEELTGKAI